MSSEASAMSTPRYIYVVQMDIPLALEAEFNRVYDEEHIPSLSKVSGFISCNRYQLETTKNRDMPRYMAIYEVADPSVVESDAWKAASKEGSWFTQIRPHTSNKRNYVLRQMQRTSP